MSRWIELDPTFDAMMTATYSVKRLADDAVGFGLFIDAIGHEMYHAPSIDIVRCGECKRANYEWSGVRCGLSDALMGADGFCSIGERRESRDR